MPRTNIIVLNKPIEIGHPVILWNDQGGLNAYDSKPAKVVETDRKTGKTKTTIIRKRFDTWRRRAKAIRQIIIHHTGGFRAARAFQTLHNERGLSVHFIIDDDAEATIYQTLDLDVVAWHAGAANPFSVGIETALFPDSENHPDAYSVAAQKKLGVQQHEVVMDNGKRVFRFTEKQMEALARLCVGIWKAFDGFGSGYTVPSVAPKYFQVGNGYCAKWKEGKGIWGHRNICATKPDPAGMDWNKLEYRMRMACERG